MSSPSWTAPRCFEPAEIEYQRAWGGALLRSKHLGAVQMAIQVGLNQDFCDSKVSGFYSPLWFFSIAKIDGRPLLSARERLAPAISRRVSMTPG